MAAKDYEEMLRTARPFFERMLLEFGEFIPFGVEVSRTGNSRTVAGDIGSEHPDGSEMIEFLKQHFRNAVRAGSIRAAAVCYIGRVTIPTSDIARDAVVIDLDGAETGPLRAALPFSLGEGGLRFGPTIASAAPSFLNQRQP